MSCVEHRPWIVTTAPYSDVYASTGVFAALQQLRQTIVDETDFYASRAYLIDPVECETRIEAFHKWYSTEGEAILREISYKILVANSTTKEKMYKSIAAAQKCLALVKTRDLDDPENLEMIWEWATEVLPSLRRAFSRFDGLDVDGFEVAEAPIVEKVCSSVESPQIYVGQGMEAIYHRDVSQVAA